MLQVLLMKIGFIGIMIEAGLGTEIQCERAIE